MGGHSHCSNHVRAMAIAEAAVIENLILGAFLVIPLVIVALLFSDELWQDHRLQLQHARPRRFDWRHPLRRSRQRL